MTGGRRRKRAVNKSGLGSTARVTRATLPGTNTYTKGDFLFPGALLFTAGELTPYLQHWRGVGALSPPWLVLSVSTR